MTPLMMCLFPLCVCVIRKLSIEAGEGDVPSQPLLEWLCLKVLGGTQLMSYTLQHCTTAFTYPPQIQWPGEKAIYSIYPCSAIDHGLIRNASGASSFFIVQCWCGNFKAHFCTDHPFILPTLPTTCRL